MTRKQIESNGWEYAGKSGCTCNGSRADAYFTPGMIKKLEVNEVRNTFIIRQNNTTVAAGRLDELHQHKLFYN